MNEDRLLLCQAISRMCKQLKLSQRITESCRECGMEELQFVYHLLITEIEGRRDNRIARRLTRAGFPMLKSLDNYDFSAVSFPSSLTKEELLQLRIVEQTQNLILYGPVGTGKTHLAIALGVLACNQDLNVRFYTVASLVTRLGEAHRTGTLEKLIRDLSRLDLLILDEWGYVPVDRQGSQLLFRVVADSYEKKSLIVTTNLEFSKWGAIFTDEQMAAAMIDRMVHHGHLMLFEGKSYRLTHALMRQAVPDALEGSHDVN